MIDTSTWTKFKVSDIFVTEKHGSGLQVPTGAMMSKKDLEDGDIPRVTVSNFNNGITGYYADSDDKNYRTYQNFISVSFLGTVFYQPDKVSLDMKVHCLKPLDYELNVYSAGYIVSIIRKAISNFAYSDQLSSTVLAELEFALPATSDGQPDWDYMESYMKAVMEESEKSLENLKKANDTKHLIDVSGWGEFRMGDLFEKLQAPCNSKKAKREIISEVPDDAHTLPLVYAAKRNNGIIYWGNEKDFTAYSNVISVIYNGAVAAGTVYAQEQDTGILAESYFIRLKDHPDIPFLVNLYLSKVIENVIYHKYTRDDLAVWDGKVKDCYIKLPITSTGKPDWQYMEDYMKNIMDKSEQIISDLQIGA